MGIRTRSMRHIGGSNLQVLDDPDRSPPKNRSKLRQRRESAVAVVAKGVLSPQVDPNSSTPPRNQRITRRSPATPTTTSSPVTTRPNRPARPQITSGPSLSILPTKSEHTMRYLPDSKVAHLKTWLEAQSSAKTLLDPTTPVRRSQPEVWLTGRRRTRAEDSEEKGQWKREIDDMSIAPVTPVRGVVRKLGAGFQSSEVSRQRPP